MMLKWMKKIYAKNKTILFIFVVNAVMKTMDIFEKYILEHIAIISGETDTYSEVEIENNNTCPVFPNDEPHLYTNQYSQFFWTAEQRGAVFNIYRFIPLAAFLFGGLYSDKYGGQRVVLTGLVLSVLVTSVLYLAYLNNNYIFLTMLAFRRISEGIIRAALISLLGKLALPEKRTTYISIFFIGEWVGIFLGDLVPRMVVFWERICVFSAFLAFATAIWWWMVCRNPNFPKIRKFKRMPWRVMMTRISLYVICCLLLSQFLTFYILWQLEHYGNTVVSRKMNEEWVVRLMLCLSAISGFVFCAVSSDGIISRGFLLVSYVRRTYFSVSLAMVFCTLIAVKLVGCDLLAVMSCRIVLQYTYSIVRCTAIAVILDFAPIFSGTVFWITYLFKTLVTYPLTGILTDIFISGDSKRQLVSWSWLYFTTAFIALLSSLPFICFGVKETIWKNLGMETLVSKRVEMDKDNSPLEAVPGPSRT